MFRNLNKKGGVMSGGKSQQAKYQAYKERHQKAYNNYVRALQQRRLQTNQTANNLEYKSSFYNGTNMSTILKPLNPQTDSTDLNYIIKDLENIAISIRIRNEAPFLDEWFQYYITIGFRNFIVYHDPNPELPDDGTNNILNFWKGYVNMLEVIRVHTDTIESHLKSDHIMSFTRKNFRYILMIDIDEFLVLSKGFNLASYLEKQWESNTGCIILERWDVVDPQDYYLEKKGGFEILQPTHIYYETNRWGKNLNISDGYKCFASPERASYETAHYAKTLNGSKTVNVSPNSFFLVHMRMRNQLSKSKYCNAKYNRTNKFVNVYRSNHSDWLKSTLNKYYCTQITNSYIESTRLFASFIFQSFLDNHEFLIIRNCEISSSEGNIVNDFTKYAWAQNPFTVIDEIELNGKKINKLKVGGDGKPAIDILVTSKNKKNI